MHLHVRTWNVFHGNTDPPGRAGFLRRMIELATADAPDVLCLQEVPAPALSRLGEWAGMRCFGAVARPPRLPGPLSTWVTELNPGLIRSGLAGQANAILVAHRHEAADLGWEQISDRGRERRIVHAVRLHALATDSCKRGSGLVVANLHASKQRDDPSVPRHEALRARAFAERVAAEGDAIVLAGDFNVRDPGLDGYTAPSDGIDDVLVRGARVQSLTVWPRERRLQDGIVLSDHAPVDCALELPS